jgi:hypothetical protein
VDIHNCFRSHHKTPTTTSMDTMTDGSQLMIIQFSRSNIFQAMRIEAEQDLSANSVTKQNRHDGKYHKASNK